MAQAEVGGIRFVAVDTADEAQLVEHGEGVVHSLKFSKEGFAEVLLGSILHAMVGAENFAAVVLPMGGLVVAADNPDGGYRESKEEENAGKVEGLARHRDRRRKKKGKEKEEGRKLEDDRFQTNKNKNDTSEPFGRKMYVAAHFHTDVFAKKCHHKRHESYPNQGIINLLELQQAHARERKANAEGINACGHGEHQQNLEARRVYAEVGIVMLLAVTIAHHLEAQETEKGAGDPSVGGSNTAQHIAKQPTDERHQCLEESEKESHRPNLSTHTPLNNAASDTDGKTIHGKSQAEQEIFNGELEKHSRWACAG